MLNYSFYIILFYIIIEAGYLFVLKILQLLSETVIS